jgi:hypothetical protein
MRMLWCGLMVAGLFLVGMSVYEAREDEAARDGGNEVGWVATASQEDGTGFPPPDPPPPPPTK